MTKAKKKNPLVVLFGRTNVGKSTLFNTLTEKKNALVSDIEGTTRDSNIGSVEWQGKHFDIVDTGGILDIKQLALTKKEKKKQKKENDIDQNVQQQARDYLSRADLILFLVDTKAGLLGDDKKMALTLKKILPDSDKIVLIANKADSPSLRKDISEFNKLSLGDPLAISATNSSGTGDMLDVIVKRLKIRKRKDVKKKKDIINVCLIGKPNSGKSSLINAFIEKNKTDEERLKKMIVSSEAHTTREPKDTQIAYNDHVINFIDTAGISKQGRKQAKRNKLKNTLEKLSIEKSLHALSRADVALLIIDLNEGLTKQETKIIDEVIARHASLIIVANKWDLIEERDTKGYTQEIYKTLPFATWAPIQFISALTGEKTQKILDLVTEISEARKQEINENYLTKFLMKIIKKHPPIKGRGLKNPYIYKLKQVHVDPPKFSVVIGPQDSLDNSYIRYIENRLRSFFNFTGTPIHIEVARKRKTHGKSEKKEEEDELIESAKTADEDQENENSRRSG